MKKILLTALVLIACYSVSFSENYKLTLEESIEIAMQKSYSMQLLKQDFKIAEDNLLAIKSSLKTNIRMELTLPNYTATVKERADSAGVYFSVKGLQYGSNLTINQPLPTDGRIYIQSGLSTTRDFYNDWRSSNLNTRIGLTQPIDALYGYNSIRSRLKQAELAYEQSNKRLKREELNLYYEVSSAYYDLLNVQKQTEIAYLDLVRQTEVYDMSKKKYEAGLIREVDALQNEVDLAEAQSNYDVILLSSKSASNAFKQTLGLNLDDNVELSSDLQQYQVVIVNPEQAVKLALENRLEMREQDIQIEQQKLAIKQQKVQGMIRGSLSAYYEKIGYAMSRDNFEIANSIDQSFSDFKTRPYNYGVAFTVQIPILDWGQNRALVRASQARLKQNEISKIQMRVSIEAEVINLVDRVNTTLKRLQLLEKSLVVAQKSFEITLQRYSDGDIDSQMLALERNRLNTSYQSHLAAYINYQLSLANLMRKTFFDFRKGEAVK